MFGALIGVGALIVDRALGNDTSPMLWGVIGMLFVNLIVLEGKVDDRW